MRCDDVEKASGLCTTFKRKFAYISVAFKENGVILMHSSKESAIYDLSFFTCELRLDIRSSDGLSCSSSYQN
jgi:hypothetical protein